MLSHDLAKNLLDNPNYPVRASIDVSTSDKDAFNRVFGLGYVGHVIDESTKELTLLFEESYQNY